MISMFIINRSTISSIHKHYITLIVLISILLACDSPTQNKVQERDAVSAKATKVFNLNNSKRSLEFFWSYGPNGSIKIKNQLLVVIKDSSGRPRDLEPNEDLEFYSFMPSMGHPLEDPGYFDRIAPGIYLNKDIIYNMSGDWKNEIMITRKDGKVVDEVSWEDFF